MRRFSLAIAVGLLFCGRTRLKFRSFSQVLIKRPIGFLEKRAKERASGEHNLRRALATLSIPSEAKPGQSGSF